MYRVLILTTILNGLFIANAKAKLFDYTCNDYCTGERYAFTVDSETKSAAVLKWYDTPMCNIREFGPLYSAGNAASVCLTPTKRMMYMWINYKGTIRSGSLAPNWTVCLPQNVLNGKASFTSDEITEGREGSPNYCGFSSCTLINYESAGDREVRLKKISDAGCLGHSVNEIPKQIGM